MDAQSVEKQQVEQVFGLTGGELENTPWKVRYTERPGYVVKDIGQETEYSYWYDGVPEYAMEDVEDVHNHRYRTIVVLSMSSSPTVMIDRETGETYRLVNTYSNSGEAECPLRGCDDEWSDGTVDDNGRCYLCDEKLNSHEADCRHHPNLAVTSMLFQNWNSMTPDQKSSASVHCDDCGEIEVSKHGHIYIGDCYEAVYKLATLSVLDVAQNDAGEAVERKVEAIWRTLEAGGHVVSKPIQPYWSGDDSPLEWSLKVYGDDKTLEIQFTVTPVNGKVQAGAALFDFALYDTTGEKNGGVAEVLYDGWHCSQLGCGDGCHSLTEVSNTLGAPFSAHLTDALKAIKVDEVVRLVNLFIAAEVK